MDNGAPAVDRTNFALASDVDEAVSRLLTSPATGARMVFLDAFHRPDALRAVIAFPRPEPLLADVCTMFEYFGLRVAGQHRLDHPPAENVVLHHFEFAAPQEWRAEGLVQVAQAVEARDRYGFAIDIYAGLILTANVTWRQVVLVRAASRFLSQAGLGMSHSYVVATLKNNPAFVTAFADYFAARFDPDIGDRDTAVAAATAALAGPIEAATTLDEDRILRAFASFVAATLRTNWFQLETDGEAKRYASFMLDSAQLSLRGPVVPHREIFVDANDVEGIHMRSGLVARGGLRLSDRPEDYRTEVLGLMKTQAVKNSPIVPAGAKGAFIRKNPKTTAEQAYCTFIAGLLDVTDNLVDGRCVSPARTVIYGGDDDYLVVAADKGTAKFSDLANAQAVQRNFWLGDAFASGGSSGYNHKLMGITARGAWVSVRRHFDDLGVDVATDPITVVGIGDMSGDVFGNGMLLSRSIRLVAAFDHRHIFLDPDPDPAVSYTERERLAALPVSSWADYDESKLSAGGGVWSRTAKNIDVGPQARDLLGLAGSTVTPNELIRAVLSADVDLLWNGGIGTYIKSAAESHSDAADPTNDAVRIDAGQLRATVIGEGGNLGLTQRARIDYALAGGRINADFIDNAAGVATSDREVNLKIALDAARNRGGISQIERNELLADARDEVASAVLGNSENQVLAISLAESQAPHLLNRHERLIHNLEGSNGIDRVTEVLPTKAELIARAQTGRGLTRPEIAVLLAHSKNVVRDELLASDVPDNPAFYGALPLYFPHSFRRALHTEITEHQLSREIIATQIADDLINHVGPGLIYQLEERLGVQTPAVATAYAIVRNVFGIDAVWEKARDQPRLPTAQRQDALYAVQQFIEHTAAWLLRRHSGPLDIPALIDRYRPHITTLHARLADGDPAQWHRLRAQAFDLSETASRLQVDIHRVADTYRSVDETLGLTWIVDGLDAYTPPNWWDAMAAAAVRDDFADTQHRLTAAVLAVPTGPAGDAVAGWRDTAAPAISRFTRMSAALRRDGLIDVSRAATANAELTLLYRRTAALAGRP